MAENQKPLWKEWWFYLMIVVFVFVIYLIFPKNPSSPYSNLEEFAQCLTDNGVVMYGTNWCVHCQNQKKLFAGDFEEVNFVDCDLRPEACNAAGVTGYPTWAINGQSYSGVQPLEVLGQVSGCELVKK